MFEKSLRTVPNFPKSGIDFIDIAPVLEDPKLFTSLIDNMAKLCSQMDFDKIVAIESRGFVFGAPLAYKMGKGLVMVRKPGKLPGDTISHSYDLEYGSDTLEILTSSLSRSNKVLILDDVLATGGSASAAAELTKKTGAQVAGFGFFIELAFLKGRERLGGLPVQSLVRKN